MAFKLVGLLMLALLLLGGCASYRTMNRQEECDRAIKNYSKLIRWQEAEKAALAFVEPAQRTAFDTAAAALRRRNVSMVDYRILAHQCLAEQQRAEATVEFDYFILPDNRLKTITDYQTWRYREADDPAVGVTAGWKLTTPLPIFK